MTSAGFILTGGRSTRMGFDKALLPDPAGRPLVLKIASVVEQAAGSVTLVGSPDLYGRLFPEFTCVTDRRAGEGPLAGIEAALTSAQAADWNVIVSCDLPGLTTGVLRQLLEQASGTDAGAVVCRDVAGAVHPLCAAYRRETLSTVSQCLDNGERRALRFLSLLHTDFIDLPDRLVNVNTPEEWRAWQTR